MAAVASPMPVLVGAGCPRAEVAGQPYGRRRTSRPGCPDRAKGRTALTSEKLTVFAPIPTNDTMAMSVNPGRLSRRRDAQGPEQAFHV